ncbi:MAG: cytochrome P450 [Filomicrobium sp.]
MNEVAVFVPPAKLPGPDRPGVFGFLSAMISDPLSVIPKSAYSEPVTSMTVLGETVGVVSDPKFVEEILIRRPQDFPKTHIDELIFKPVLGDGLLTAQGDDWKWKRRLVAPYFSPSRLDRRVPDMVVPFEELASEWHAAGSRDDVDITSSMTAATFEVISRTLFTNQSEIDFGTLSRAIDNYLGPISWVVGLSTLRMPSWIPHPGKAQLRDACDAMRQAVGDLIAARRRSGNVGEDICGDLMRAQDADTGRELSDADLIDMLLTLIAAGHETSANGLTWTLFCLANQPGLQERLAEEVDEVCGGRPLAAADIPKLTLVEAFIKESMRLFPPAPLMARQSSKPEQFGSHHFKSGTTLFIPVYAIHRHDALWPAPGEFRIERFLNGDNGKGSSRTAYMPFGAGPRICVGWAFAMMEMKVALAVLLQKVRFSTTALTDCDPIHRVTLRPRNGMRLKVTAA